MFADPLTITIFGVAKPLIRINQDKYSSEYLLKEATGEYRLQIRNTTYNDKTRGGLKVERHNVELVHTVYPVAPATRPIIRKSYAVFEMDQGDDLASVSVTVAGLGDFLTDTNVTKMLGFQS